MIESLEEQARRGAFLASRRAHLEHILECTLEPSAADALPPERRCFLREEAEELYWNELSWERVVVEETGRGGEPVELAFAGFLAFIEGLLLSEPAANAKTTTVPRTGVVEDTLLFLSGRCLALEDEEGKTHEFQMVQRLIDLVLYRLHGIAVEPAPPAQRMRPPNGRV